MDDLWMSVGEPLLPVEVGRASRARALDPSAAGRSLLGLVERRASRPPIWPLFLIGLALLCLGLLIGPRVPAADAGYNCVGNVALEGPFGFSLNCDSPEFMWLAREPSALLDQRNSRQSRPGLILLAALIQAPLSTIIPADGPPTPVYQGLYDPPLVAASLAQDRPAYVAYILLNFAILVASFHTLHLVIRRHRPAHDGATAIILLATGLLIVANDVTKAFFWSPHTQMFNILVPVLAVYATQRVVADRRIERDLALGMGLLAGLGMTAYPVFVVIPACVLLPAIVGLLREKSAAARRRDFVSLAILLALGAMPSALWYAYVQTTARVIFNAELDLRQVLWMKDALAEGPGVLAAQWFENLRDLLAFAAPQALALAAFAGLLVLSGLFAWARDRLDIASLSAAVPIIAIGLYVSFAVLGFYTCVGWVVDRLAYPTIPPLIAAAGVTAVVAAQQMRPAQRSVLAGGCLAVAVAQMIYVVAKNGPWS
jgi:hypothetical protein